MKYQLNYNFQYNSNMIVLLYELLKFKLLNNND